jgi:hypothetical protein
MSEIDDPSADFESLHPRAIYGMRLGACLGALGLCQLPVVLLWIVLRASELAPDARWPLLLLAAAAIALGLLLGWRYAALRHARTRSGCRLRASSTPMSTRVRWTGAGDWPT